jgi:hypothetical protein
MGSARLIRMGQLGNQRHTRGSALLGFVKDDAVFIAQAIAASAKDAGAQSAPPSGSALLMPTAAPLHHDSSPSR